MISVSMQGAGALMFAGFFLAIGWAIGSWAIGVVLGLIGRVGK